MRRQDYELAHQLEEELLSFDSGHHPLPGIHNTLSRAVLIEQILESIRRVAYPSVIRERGISDRRADPNHEMFDPLRAAILHQDRGQIDEAFWMVFLFVHFGKHARAGWRYAREIYGRLGAPERWDWTSTSTDPSGFRSWLDAHQDELMREGVPRGFGPHRRYQSLNAYSPTGTGAAVESYIEWVDPPRTHHRLMQDVIELSNGDPRRAFDYLYQGMKKVTSFGRLARFDYLSMVGKLGLAPIEAGSTYMKGATGPLKGARLLFGAHESTATQDRWLGELDARLNVGMQVIEDALCNWEKSPYVFIPFRS